MEESSRRKDSVLDQHEGQKNNDPEIIMPIELESVSRSENSPQLLRLRLSVAEGKQSGNLIQRLKRLAFKEFHP
jgi:hypothetical protein